MNVDIIVCNLTRLGDLLQTQPLINDLHSAGLKVGLVCLDNFLPAARLLRNVYKIYPLPGSSLLAATDRSWSEAAQQLLKFTGDIIKHAHPKYVLNLTPSLPARLLCRLLASGRADILGFGLDEYGFGLNQGMWASFFAAAASKRINAPFNLADMLRNLALPIVDKKLGDFCLAMPPKAALDFADNFTGALVEGQKGYIAFQLGASEERRRWPVSSFCQLGSRIWREAGYIPILLGSAQETKLGEEYANGADHPYLNAIGKTDFEQLAALLRKCKLLVTNDTGTMHLASGQGVPSLAFFLATAQPCDTGPLLDDCCCLEPALDCHPCAFGQTCTRNLSCRNKISPEAAGDLLLGKLLQGEWSAGLSPTADSQCRVWLTSHGKEGFARVNCISSHASEDRSLWMIWLKNFWRQLLDHLSQSSNFRENKNIYANLAKPSFSTAVAANIEQAAAILDSIEACGQVARKNKQAGQLLLRNCERLQSVLNGSSQLASLATFWQEFRQNQGADFDLFLPATAILSHELKKLGHALVNIS